MTFGNCTFERSVNLLIKGAVCQYCLFGSHLSILCNLFA